MRSPGRPAPRARHFLPITAVAVAVCALLVPAVATGVTWDTTTVAYDSEVVARIDGTGAAEAVGGFDYFGGGPLLSSVTRPWHGPWSAATPIADLPVPFAPDHVIQQVSNSAGDVVLLAQRGDKGDLVAHGRTRGVLLAPQVLTTGGVPNAAPERLVMNDAGEALVAWQSGGRVRVATRTPDGVWSAAVTLDRDAQPYSGATMDAALNNAGDALVVWRHRQRSPNTLRSAQRVPSGRWSTPLPFGGRHQGAGDATVALDDTGGAVVVWHLVRLRVGVSTSKKSLWVAQKPWRSARWSPPQRLRSGVELIDVGLGIDAVGNAVAISGPTGIAHPPWWRPLRAWHRSPTGPWVSQAPPRNRGSDIDLTVSRFGRAVALFGCGDIEATTTGVARLPGGSWSSAPPLTATGYATCPNDAPQINDAGDAVVTWGQPVGNYGNPGNASVLDGPATAGITSLTATGRRIAAGVSRPGRLLVSLRRPAARHLAAAFFIQASAGTRAITLPTAAEGASLAGRYVATVETGSRDPSTRSRSVTVTLADP